MYLHILCKQADIFVILQVFAIKVILLAQDSRSVRIIYYVAAAVYFCLLFDNDETFVGKLLCIVYS